MTPQRLPFVAREGWENSLRNLYLGTDLGQIDLLGEVLGLGDYPAVFALSLPVPMPYGEYRMLSLDGLITAKEALDREKDRAAVRLLRGIRDGIRPPPPPPEQIDLL